jgi:hypothetical protein
MWQLALIIAAALQWGTPGQGWAPERRTNLAKPVAQCQLPAPTGTGLANRYLVQVNSYNLGAWQKLTESGSVATLVRAVDANSNATHQMVQQWQSGPQSIVTISLLDSTGTPIAHQTLIGAKPTKWSINNMDAGASQVSVETLVLNFTSIRCA